LVSRDWERKWEELNDKIALSFLEAYVVETIVAAITSALVAGAKDGLTEVTKKGLSDGYDKLKSLLLRHGGGRTDIVDALEKVEAKPESQARRAVLSEELESSGAANDTALQEQANLLLDLVRAQPAGNTSAQIASGTGIAQADRGSSATVTIAHPQR
jgi:hypothetical protein